MRIMNRHIFQNILFLLLAIGCTKEPIKTIQNTLIIQGENVARFNTSRNTLNEGLPAGSTLTFYSQGGIHADEFLLSYNGSNWEGENLPEWEDSQQPAVSCSFCPPLYRNHQSFYQMVSYATSSMPKPPQTTEKTFIYLFSTCLHVSYLMYPAN